MLFTSVFLILLAAGSTTDIRSRRVPNALVLAMLAGAFVVALTRPDAPAAMLAAAGAALLGLALWLPFWLLGMLGAGDVKFFAAGAAWIGPSLTWRAALVAALLGGVYALAVLVWRHGARTAALSVAAQVRDVQSLQLSGGPSLDTVPAAQRSLPYAVPMACALAIAAVWPMVLLGGLVP